MLALWEAWTYGGRNKAPKLDPAVGRAVASRLTKARAELLDLIARFSRGEVLWRGPRAARPRGVGAGAVVAREACSASVDEGVPDASHVALPLRAGWLCQLMPYEAASIGGQLEAVLRSGKMVVLMQATPRVARALRPTCRMLGCDMALLLQPKDARVPVRKIRVPRPRKPRKPSYTDIEYRCGPDLDGRRWVLRLSRSGLRYKRLPL